MEVQDISAIAEAAHRAGAIVMIDNTWSAGHYFKAFEHAATSRSGRHEVSRRPFGAR